MRSFLFLIIAACANTAAADEKCPNNPPIGFELPTGSLVLESEQNGTAVKLTVVDYTKDRRQVLTAVASLKLKPGIKFAKARRDGWLYAVEGDKLSEPGYGFDGLNALMPILDLPSVTLEGDADNDWRLKIAPKWTFTSQESGEEDPLAGDPGPVRLSGGMGFGYRESQPIFPKEGWTWHLPVLLDIKVNVAASLKRLLPCARGFYWIRVDHPEPKAKPAPRGNGA